MQENNSKIGERVEFASRFVPICNNLLDIGSGKGLLKNYIESKVKKIIGIDNDKKSLLICKKKYSNVHKIDLNSEDIPYINNFFDCVTCLDVIEHIQNPIVLLQKINRILKFNGLLIISTPNIRFSDHIWSLFYFGKFPKTSLDSNFYDGGHIHFFTYKDLKELLIFSKFRIIKEEGIINKPKRGWKGRLLELLLGKRLMNEFRSPGILLVAQKI